MDKRALFGCWKLFQREHNISIDRLVCAPELRQAFILSADAACGSSDEEEILWSLLTMRKNKHFQMSKKSAGM